MSNANHRSVPVGRGRRLLKLGHLAGGIAAGAMAEGIRQIGRGQRPAAPDMLLTPANAARLAQRLSELRGAAMKVGQLLSMEAGDLIPPALSEVLARLREDAHRMPLGEVAAVLEAQWGKDWAARFERFDFTPLAAASIGQVHQAIDKTGRRLAVKLQYPGIRDSIDSDVDSVAGLLSLFRLVPDKAVLAPLFEQAKRQLHEEANYLHEAEHGRQYARCLGDDPDFYTPRLVDDWNTERVLVMSFVDGESIERVASRPQAERDRVAAALVRLALRELFEWGRVQTDPNFANYRYDPASGRIGLLDFGAVREYPPQRVAELQALFAAATAADRAALVDAAAKAGYLDGASSSGYRDAMAELLLAATEPLRHPGAYDFGQTDLSSRMADRLIELRVRAKNWQLPPVDLLFLHRRLGGLFMLCQRLRARVDVGSLAATRQQRRDVC